MVRAARQAQAQAMIQMSRDEHRRRNQEWLAQEQAQAFMHAEALQKAIESQMGTEIHEKGNNEETKKQEPAAIEIIAIKDGKVQFKNLLEAGDSTYG